MRIARALQLIGYVLYVMAGALRLISGGDAAPWPWIAAYATFGLAFHLGASVPASPPYRRRRLVALAIMTPAMLAMAFVRPCPYGALTLVIAASQAALVLDTVAVAVWVVVQTAVIGACVVFALGWVFGVAELIALLGFQAFAIATIVAARRETEVRVALTRYQERTRIARDLHDVLGHDLTALALQLEIASHVAADAARGHAEKARELTSRLLDDVRRVVAATRDDHPPSLANAIRAIVMDVPGLAIHLEAPESLVMVEPGRTECIVRCVQEIVTNTRRHARGAENLWVRLRREADEVVVEAHDDGTATLPIRHGHGLRGMRSRLEEMGGELQIRTAPELVLTARLPLGAQS